MISMSYLHLQEFLYDVIDHQMMIMIQITNNPYLKSLTPGSRAPTAADAFGKKNDLWSYCVGHLIYYFQNNWWYSEHLPSPAGDHQKRGKAHNLALSGPRWQRSSNWKKKLFSSPHFLLSTNLQIIFLNKRIRKGSLMDDLVCALICVRVIF